MSKEPTTVQPTTLNCTITTRITMQCESHAHATAVVESLKRWGEREMYRIEPMERVDEISVIIFPSTPPPAVA